MESCRRICLDRSMDRVGWKGQVSNPDEDRECVYKVGDLRDPAYQSRLLHLGTRTSSSFLETACLSEAQLSPDQRGFVETGTHTNAFIRVDIL
jgi:hypothetical protein